MKTYTAPQLLDQINAYLEQMPYSRPPKGLYEPIAYELSLGGKRVRPVLMLMAYNIYKEDVERILPQAAGLETYHNHTLLHDDVMDKADMRRNKPTVHNVWNDNTAILSGDAMLILLQSIEPSSFTLLGWFSLPTIDQYSSLLPPVGSQ